MPGGKDEGPPSGARRSSDVEFEQLTESLDQASITRILRLQDALEERLRDRYRHLAVLFADIAGSTAFFERYGDLEGRKLVQRVQDLVKPAVLRNDGRIVKHIGDAVMATFPGAREAVAAAMEIQFAMAAASWVQRTDTPVAIRVGVNYGQALVNDSDGDVYGDMVNVASRVQTAAGPGQIMISEEARRELDGNVPVQAAGRFSLKGKADLADLYEVLWRSLAPADVERPRVDSRYRLHKRLGGGAMSEVWHARDDRLNREVALKVLRRGLNLSPTTAARLQADVQQSAGLAHENVVRVYDCSLDGDQDHFVAMELLESRTLRDLLNERGKLSPFGALLVAHAVAEGLGHAHGQRIVHRDVRPENVLVSSAGEVKIGDFGLAAVEREADTASGLRESNNACLAPEMITGAAVGAPTDVFSLGVVLYEMIAGRSPFKGPTPLAVADAIVEGRYVPLERVARLPAPASALVDACLAPDPAQRPRSGTALAAELRRLLLTQWEVDDARDALQRWFASDCNWEPESTSTIAGPLLPPGDDRPLRRELPSSFGARPRTRAPESESAASAATVIAPMLVQGDLGKATEPSLPAAPAPRDDARQTLEDPSLPPRRSRGVLVVLLILLAGVGAVALFVLAPQDAAWRRHLPWQAGQEPWRAWLETPARAAPGPEVPPSTPAAAEVPKEAPAPEAPSPTKPATPAPSPAPTPTAEEPRAPAEVRSGYLELLSRREFVSIIIDGEYIGQMPLDAIPLAPGQHVVEAQAPNGAKWRQQVRIRPGQRVVRRIRFDR